MAIDRRARVLDDGAVLIGGAPPRLVQLAPAARRLLRGGRLVVTDATSAAVARRLLDAGIAHPVHADAPEIDTSGVAGRQNPSHVDLGCADRDSTPAAGDVTVVVPVRDRAPGLRRLLDALGGAHGEIVVVDDGSVDAAAVRTVAEDAGARVVRHQVSGGPAAARNAGAAAASTPLVAFLDSDVVPEPGWLEPLLAHVADPAVALAAPRIVALAPVTGWLGRYEAVRSSLDLGPDPALIVPRTRVAYVPSAALLVRRDALGAGFDERLQVAEDVDLVLRLHAAGWRLRYEPASRVAHDHRTSLRAWWLRKAYYGTGAAPLAVRYAGAVPPMVLSPWSAAVSALLLSGRPRALVGAVVVSAVAAERLSRRLTTVRHPRSTAARLIGRGTLGAVAQTSDALTRHYWPLAALACVASRRARRTVAVVALVDGVVDWWRHRDRHPGIRPSLSEHLLARRLDDLAYGAGLWWGALRVRTVAPLLPAWSGRGQSGPARPQLSPGRSAGRGTGRQD